jgi:uroporphyrin-III C-methyltransferase
VDWEALAAGPGTLVLLMAVARLPEVARELVKRGRDASTPAAVISDGTTERQQVLVSTLGQVAEDAAANGVRPPAVVVIGEVVRLREALGQYASGPDVSRQDAPGPDVSRQDAPGPEAAAQQTLGAA